MQDKDITAILASRDGTVPDRVVPLLLGRLRRIAHQILRRKPSGSEFEPASLINELYAELKDVYDTAGETRRVPADRHEFLAFSATLMRRIVVRDLRRLLAAKRGGDRTEVQLEHVRNLAQRTDLDLPTLLTLDAALDRLGETDARLQSIVEMRFFAGYTIEETAQALDVSPMTIKRSWRLAVAYLYDQLAETRRGSSRAPRPDLEIPLVASRRSQCLEATRLGAYTVLRRLGSGGSAETYLARLHGDRDARSERFVIKVMRPELVDSEECRKLFDREFAARRLDLPDIAFPIDHGTSPCGRPFLVSQYIEGESIVEHCRLRRYGVRRRLRLFDRLCEIVDQLHNLGTVHCDLKPSNVMVTPLGLVRLLDFGIARSAWQRSRSSQELQWLTFTYACPEQRRGEPPTPAWDLYALGTILHELLTGHPPEAEAISARSLGDAILDSSAAFLEFGSTGGEPAVEGGDPVRTDSSSRAHLVRTLAPALARALAPKALARHDVASLRRALREAELVCVARGRSPVG